MSLLLFATAPARATATGDEGCPPPFWSSHPEEWLETEEGVASYDPGALFTTTFGLDPGTHPSTATLDDALGASGGRGVAGAQRFLARAATAAILNAAHEGVGYPLSRTHDTAAGAAILPAVQGVWDSGDRRAIFALAASYTVSNHLGCPLDPVDALATASAALVALPIGACGALVDPWLADGPSDPMRVWDLVLEDDWDDLKADLALHDDGTCPGRPDGWTTEGECTTSEGWVSAGTQTWSASSSGGSADDFVDWGLAHSDGEDTYQAVADGRSTRWVNRPVDANDVVTYGRSFEDFRVGRAHGGAEDVGTNGRLVREGQLATSVAGWPVTGEVYVLVDASDRVARGDLCAGFDLADVATCASEPVGTYRILGAEESVVTFDGDHVCDGCGLLTVGGRDAGEVCLAP